MRWGQLRNSHEGGLLSLLILSSGLSLVLLVARIAYLRTPTFTALAWNLFLGWIPMISALLIWQMNLHGEGDTGQRPARCLEGLLLGIWFFFFPNAPYMVTDILHLMPRAGAPLWYDLLLLFTFAWNGLLLGFVSLWIVQSIAERRWGWWLSWLMAIVTLVSAGFGIYVGRFLRWNSWDLLTNPQLLVHDVMTRILDPVGHPSSVAVTLIFSSFLLLAYVTLRLLVRTSWGKPSVRADLLKR